MIDPMDAIDAFSTLVAAASPDPDQAGNAASTLAGQSADPALGAAAGYLTSSDVAMAADIAAAPESAPTETAATAVASASQAARSDSSTASIIEDAPVAAAVGVILIGGAAVFVLGSALEGLVGLASAVGERGLFGGAADIAATGAGADAAAGAVAAEAAAASGGTQAAEIAMAAGATGAAGADLAASGAVDAAAGGVVGAADAVVGSMAAAETATVAAGSQVADIAAVVVGAAGSVVEAAHGLLATGTTVVAQAGVAALDAGLATLSASLAALAGLVTLSGGAAATFAGALGAMWFAITTLSALFRFSTRMLGNEAPASADNVSAETVSRSEVPGESWLGVAPQAGASTRDLLSELFASVGQLADKLTSRLASQDSSVSTDLTMAAEQSSLSATLLNKALSVVDAPTNTSEGSGDASLSTVLLDQAVLDGRTSIDATNSEDTSPAETLRIEDAEAWDVQMADAAIPEASEVLESRGAKMSDAEADLAPEIADAEPPEAATAAATTVIVCVPDDIYEGMEFSMEYEGQQLAVVCPSGCGPGTEISVLIPAPQPSMQVEVEVPIGCYPGMQFTVELEGQRYNVGVPEGVNPGDALLVDVPPRT